MRYTQYMAAGSAAQIPAGDSGLWVIRKVTAGYSVPLPDGGICPPGAYTALCRYTDSNATYRRRDGHG